MTWHRIGIVLQNSPMSPSLNLNDWCWTSGGLFTRRIQSQHFTSVGTRPSTVVWRSDSLRVTLLNTTNTPSSKMINLVRFYSTHLLLSLFVGINLLSAHIAHGAIHDSHERYPTREMPSKVHLKISAKSFLNWIQLDPNPDSYISWLYRPAGAGKSATMQTIAELLREVYLELYGGSFLFCPWNSWTPRLQSSLFYR